MKKVKRILSMVLVCILLVGITQPYAFAAKGDVSENYLQYGDAKNIYNDVYELTELETWKSGGIWINQLIDTQSDFKVSFSYCAGEGRDYSYGGADGIVLAFSQNIGLGADGEYMGFISSEAYGVEFDSYSGNPNDPEGKHIAVIYDQSSNHLAYTLDDRVDDSEWHDVEVSYANNSVEVYLDGQNVLFCQNVYLPDEVYLGLSAATGSGQNRHLVSNFGFEYVNSNNEPSQIVGEEFRFASNTTINCIAKNSTVDIYAGYYVDGALTGKNYQVSVGDASILQIKNNGWDNTYGQHLSLTAKKAGSTTLTVVDASTGATGSLNLNVVDSEIVCSFDNVPKMTIEEGKTTNFYSYSGMIVDDFNYKEIKVNGTVDHYAVTMTVYNKLNLYGAVTAYDADGNICDYCVIDKFTSMDSNFVDSVESLIKSTGDLFYLFGNDKYYSGESISKKTVIKADAPITVPVGGYLEISNNVSSPVALFANMAGITIDFMATTGRLANSAGKVLDAKGVIVDQLLIDAFTKDYAGEKAVETIKKLAEQELKNGNWSLYNFGDGIQSLFDVLTKSGINFVELLAKETTSVTGLASITESIVMDIIPTGQLIKSLYTFSDVGELIIESIAFNKSVDYPMGIYLHPSAFSDVSTKAYYYDAVKWAVENGITSGTSDTTFSPDSSCTRAQAVTFLWRAAGEPEPKGTGTKFTDVPNGQYYSKAVQWAVENNITSGTSDTTFSPDQICNRAQIVTFLYRVNGSPSANGNAFSDVQSRSYYSSAVKWAVAQGITSGTSGTTFSPLANCTRGQIVTFLYRSAK